MKRIVRFGTLPLVIGAFLTLMVQGSHSASASGSRAPGPTASWTTRLFAPGPSQFSDISCPTSLVCTAVGGGATYSGAIFRTSDGGRSWTRQTSPEGTSYLDGVDCPTTRFCLAEYLSGGGYAEASWSTFAVTRDGGAHWATSTGSPESLGGPPACARPTRCFATESGYPVGRTTDGGTTWKNLSMVGWDAIERTACVRASNCFVVGTFGRSRALGFGEIVGYGARIRHVGSIPAVLGGNPFYELTCSTSSSCALMNGASASGRVLTTSNGGRSWVTRRLPPSIRVTMGISCASATYCVVPGTSRLRSGPLLAATTTDDGATWSVGIVAADPGGLGVDVSCPSTGTCFLDGPGDDATLVRATGATSWSLRRVPSGPTALSAVACPTTALCDAVGPGVAMRSTDGGITWTTTLKISPYDSTILGALACPTAMVCLAGGLRENPRFVPSPVLYRSENGGMTWQRTAAPAVDATITSISCATVSICVASSADSSYEPTGSHLLRSTDGGMTWSIVSKVASGITGISCSSQTDCTAVTFSGAVYVTSDAGASWTPSAQVSADFGSVDCLSSTTCLASGAEPEPGSPAAYSQTGIYKTVNGGTGWTLLASPLASTGPGTVACAGSVCQVLGQGFEAPPTLDSSTDGGADWSLVTVPNAPATMSDATMSPSGRWVLVGGDSLNGALVATSP